MSITESVDIPDPVRAGSGRRLSVRPLTVAGNDLVLFTESAPIIESIREDLKRATHRIWLESYIFADDAAGNSIADVLKERAKAGLDVRVIYDAVGCIDTSQQFFDDMEAAGVQVHAFHTFREALTRFSLFRVFNRRDHRKLVIVDDRVAYFGGMNIVDQSELTTVADVKASHLPPSAGWRDLHVRLCGPKQPEAAEAFERLWKKVKRLKGKPRTPWPIQQMLSRPPETIHFFDCQPKFRSRRAALVFCPLIREARQTITLSMAYFIPVGSVLRELIRARRRGVTIRVIVPGESDVKLVQRATQYFYDKLLRLGFRIYERNDYMLHSKAMVVDDEWSVIGSCNLDPRSLRLNLEFVAVMRSEPLALAVKQVCAYEMRNSRRVTEHWHGKRSWLDRALDRCAWAFRRWL